jgi:branched-chain amino acid transport system substrate-binding protein
MATKWTSNTARIGTAVLTAALMATACSSSSKSSSPTTAQSSESVTTTPSTPTSGPSANQASAPGVTSGTITVGLIAPLTGAEAPDGVGMAPSAQARIDVVNAAGGVDGRQLKLVVEDDKSSAAGNLAAAQALVQEKGVLAVDDNSGFAFGAAKYLQGQGIPVVGGGYDAPEWGMQPYTNMFSTSTALWVASPPPATQPATLMKQLGVTTVASLGFGISPSSKQAAETFATAAEKVGLKVGYVNSSLPFGTVDTTAVALAMKQNHVDGIAFFTDSATAFAVITSAKQAGIPIKASVVANGYGQILLNQTTAVQAAQGTVFNPIYAPVELHSQATEAMQAAFKQYANHTGVPDFGWYQGWTSLDLMIKGLQVAGQNPTRQSFISNLRQVTNYNAGGLIASPINYTQFGKLPPETCAWYVELQGDKFVLVPSNGAPTCSTPLQS